MILVTKPFLPPKEEYDHYINGVWQRNWLTNDGPLVNELELKLKEHLDLKHLAYVTNGTTAIQLAIKALELTGEVITTPFSYVASTSSIVWENCTPVFVDIDAQSLNLDPNLIEDAITPNTSAILATHVYGNACDIQKIDEIASKHNLKVIYDAAHCFGTLYNERSILEYGDMSTLSFHATKVFHTVEGGAVITKNPYLLYRLTRLRNFGHAGPENFDGIGINGKNSEFHAAMGLANLKYIDDILKKRKGDFLHYQELLVGRFGMETIKINPQCQFNYSYIPIVFNSEDDCVKVLEALKLNNINARRYFYPLLSTLDYVNDTSLPIANDVSPKVLCLPTYFELSKEEVDLICRIIIRTLTY